MWLTMAPPALQNQPPTYKMPPDITSEFTVGVSTPLIPEPNADQVLPSHLAMELAPISAVVPK
jgi:hypothetical protein